MHFAANHIDDDPQTAQLLQGLVGVRIRIYRIDGDAGRVTRRMEDMAAHLQAGGWDPGQKNPQGSSRMITVSATLNTSSAGKPAL